MLYRFMEFDILPSTLLRTLLICLVKHLPKYISLPLIPEDWREGLVRFEEKNVFIGFQKSNLIVLLIFSLLLLQYEIYSVCNAIVIIFLIEKHFFLNQFYVTLLIFSPQKLYFSSIYFFCYVFRCKEKM